MSCRRLSRLTIRYPLHFKSLDGFMKKILILTFIIIAHVIPLTSLGEEESCGEEGECIEGDCENGPGTYIFTDGSSYSGTWKDGFPEGSGTLKYIDGSKDEGKWSGGLFIGEMN